MLFLLSEKEIHGKHFPIVLSVNIEYIVSMKSENVHMICFDREFLIITLLTAFS